jgi:hypothetical protein
VDQGLALLLLRQHVCERLAQQAATVRFLERYQLLSSLVEPRVEAAETALDNANSWATNALNLTLQPLLEQAALEPSGSCSGQGFYIYAADLAHVATQDVDQTSQR